MAAKALLDHTPSPTLKDVHHGLSGNFCRCGTYAGMRLAVLAAAPLMGDEEEEEEDVKDGADEREAQGDGARGERKKKKKKKRRRGHG
jgi:xanthine dehydrogenase iron-sulfur cluster and FAD-binding subunit A